MGVETTSAVALILEKARRMRQGKASKGKPLSDIPEEPLLKPEDVAKALALEVRTVREWAAEGKVEHIRLPNGHIRFRRQVIAELLMLVPAEPRRRGNGP